MTAFSANGNDLERLNSLVNFEMFRHSLEAAVPRKVPSKRRSVSFDQVLMFKILILQAMYRLSDERCEYLIKDRISFMRFLGLSLAERVPKARAIWTFRDDLTKAGVIDDLFQRFYERLRARGYSVTDGEIIDATIVVAELKRRDAIEEDMPIYESRTTNGLVYGSGNGGQGLTEQSA